ncbi:PQQ-binding-like beta-propeller repeat protein [Actinomadura miaoliensis]|uniref:Pyrrolo-quinoline quinone repeat domain-containing protein n=1 Tax=Actinomadura miaoliensis TaxID=430685 RepID=A0ABP7X4V7_9ACTN
MTLGLNLLLLISIIFVIATVRSRLRRSAKQLIAAGSAALLAFALGYWPADRAFGALRGRLLQVAWTTPSERPATTRAAGVWSDGPRVVRARFDRLIAYDVEQQASTWVHELPARVELCAMSRSTSGGVGLIGYGPAGTTCTTLAAIDLRTGRTLWTRSLGSRRFSASEGREADRIEISARAAVVAGDATVMAFAPRTGRPLWRWSVPGCTPRAVGNGPGGTVVLSGCGARGFTVSVLNPRTGRPLRRTAVTDAPEGQVRSAELVSAHPLLVKIGESGERGREVLHTFDETGRPRAAIPFDDQDGKIELEEHPGDFPLRPVRRFAVHGDTLLLVAEGDDHRTSDALVAYSPTTGERKWSRPQKRLAIKWIRLTGDRIEAPVSSSTGRHLRVRNFSLTGAKIGGDLTNDDQDIFFYSGALEPVTVGEFLVVVRADATKRYGGGPITALRPK